MRATIYNAMSDDDFRLKAFADYCDDVQMSYQRLLAATNEAIDIVEDDEDNDPEGGYTNEYIEEKVDEILESQSISENNMLLFEDGYVSAKSYLMTIATQFRDNLLETQSESTSVTTPLINAAGSNTTEYDANQLVEGVKTNLYSLTSLCAANRAMLCDNVADRISVYNDKLQTTFNNAYSTVASTASLMRQVITEKSTDIKTYLANVSALLNVNALAEDNSESVPSESDISKYSGASPICALNFNGFFNTVGTIINAGVKVVAGVLASAVNLVGGLFKKVFGYIHQVVIDPKDIEAINNDVTDSTYSVDGWCFNSDSAGYSQELPSLTAGYLEGITAEGLLDITEYYGKWIKYEDIFGETLINLTSMEKVSTNHYIPHFRYRFKPKSINPEVVYNSLLNSGIGQERTGSDGVKYYLITPRYNLDFTFDKVEQWILDLKNNPDLYLSTDASEKNLLMGFNIASGLAGLLSRWAHEEMEATAVDPTATNPMASDYFITRIFKPSDVNSEYLPSVITNKHFLIQVTGWNENDSEFICDNDPYLPSTTPDIKLVKDYDDNYSVIDTGMGYYYLCSWLLNQMDRKMNPTSYTFVPYRNNVESFRISKFRIVTDAENQAAFRKFLTVTLVIVFAIAITVTSIILIKKISRNLYMKRTAAVGRMDNAMWNGEELTAKQKRKYIRLQRKLNGSNAISSGLQDASSFYTSVSDSVSTVSEDISGVQQIMSLIR